MSYKEKYFKYKNKYLKLRNQKGGMGNCARCEKENSIIPCGKCSNTFYCSEECKELDRTQHDKVCDNKSNPIPTIKNKQATKKLLILLDNNNDK